jgi:hypothetical protein
VLVTLQHLLFGAHRIMLDIRWVIHRIGAGFGRLLSQGKEVEVVGKEKDNDSPKLATNFAKSKVVGNEKENEK